LEGEKKEGKEGSREGGRKEKIKAMSSPTIPPHPSGCSKRKPLASNPHIQKTLPRVKFS